MRFAFCLVCLYGFMTTANGAFLSDANDSSFHIRCYLVKCQLNLNNIGIAVNFYINCNGPLLP